MRSRTHGGGEIRRLTRRLDDRRDPGEQRRRQLLEHAPHREVEGVDLERDARQGRVHVPPDEGSLFADRLDIAIGEQVAIGQLAPGAAAVREEGADAAVDVAGGIASGRAGRGRQLEVRGFARVEVGREGLQRCGSGLEGHALERRTTDPARVVDECPGVEAGAGQAGNRVAGRRIGEHGPAVRRGVPRSGDVAGQHLGHRKTPGIGDRFSVAAGHGASPHLR